MIAMEPGAKQNLRSGFRKTGIVPLNKQEVISRLPNATLDKSLADLTTCIGDTFLQELKKRRQEETKPKEKKRRKKVDVPEGKSIGTSDVHNGTNEGTAKEATMSTENTTSKGKERQKSCKQKKRKQDESEERVMSVRHFLYKIRIKV